MIVFWMIPSAAEWSMDHMAYKDANVNRKGGEQLEDKVGHVPPPFH